MGVKKAELETLLHVGYIRHVCIRLYYLFLDCKYIIYWHLYVVVSLLRQLAHNMGTPHMKTYKIGRGVVVDHVYSLNPPGLWGIDPTGLGHFLVGD